MDAKKILEKIDDSGPKTRFTVSVDEQVFKDFKKIIGTRPVSQVIEQILKEFINSAEPKKK